MWFLKKSVTFHEEELSDLLRSLNSIVWSVEKAGSKKPQVTRTNKERTMLQSKSAMYDRKAA